MCYETHDKIFLHYSGETCAVFPTSWARWRLVVTVHAPVIHAWDGSAMLWQNFVLIQLSLKCIIPYMVWLQGNYVLCCYFKTTSSAKEFSYAHPFSFSRVCLLRLPIHVYLLAVTTEYIILQVHLKTHITHSYLEHFLCSWFKVSVTGGHWWWVNIGPGNGLMPSGIKHYLDQFWSRSPPPSLGQNELSQIENAKWNEI